MTAGELTASDWRALADEYYALALKYQRAGDREAAIFWRRAGDACRAEAKRIEAAARSVKA